jgi:hypothetical protein
MVDTNTIVVLSTMIVLSALLVAALYFTLSDSIGGRVLSYVEGIHEGQQTSEMAITGNDSLGFMEQFCSIEFSEILPPEGAHERYYIIPVNCNSTKLIEQMGAFSEQTSANITLAYLTYAAHNSITATMGNMRTVLEESYPREGQLIMEKVYDFYSIQLLVDHMGTAYNNYFALVQACRNEDATLDTGCMHSFITALDYSAVQLGQATEFGDGYIASCSQGVKSLLAQSANVPLINPVELCTRLSFVYEESLQKSLWEPQFDAGTRFVSTLTFYTIAHYHGEENGGVESADVIRGIVAGEVDPAYADRFSAAELI